jgi:hypothetical protein
VFSNCKAKDLAASSSSANAFTACLLNATIAVALNATPKVRANPCNCLLNTDTS